jgi:hypothetical protein
MRTFTIPADQILPALSTEVGERPYTFTNFVAEWIMSSKQLREDDNLEAAFAFEDWMNAQKDWTVGASVTMPEDIWTTAKSCAKASIDEAMTPGPGGTKLPLPWAFRILRHYHILAKAASDGK